MTDVPLARGGHVRWQVTFSRNGSPWTDVGDFEPTCQVRLASDSSVISATPAMDITDEVAEFLVDDTASLLMTDEVYEWDVRFVDPDTGDVFFWPGPEEDRNTLTMGPTVTREVVAP